MNDVVVTEKGLEVRTRDAVVPVEFEPLESAAHRLLGARNPRLARLDRPTLAALLAAHEVLTLKSPSGCAPHPQALAVIVDDGSASADRTYWGSARDRGGAQASPQLFAATLPSAVAGELAMTFGLRGPCLVLAGGACEEADIEHVPGLTRGPCLVVRVQGWEAPGGGRVTARMWHVDEATPAAEDRR